MRLKTRMMLAAGCVSLLALSIPAFSLPSPRGLEKQRTNVHGAIQNKKAALRAPQGHANARAARANRAARLVSMPITEPPKRPMFGWRRWSAKPANISAPIRPTAKNCGARHS